MQKLRPWSVKGVSSEAREAARVAAAGADLGIGTWIDQAIKEATSSPAAGAAATASTTAGTPPSADTASPPSLIAAIAELEQQVSASQLRTAGTVGPVRDAIEDLTLRIDTLERHKRLLPRTTLFADKDSRPVSSADNPDTPADSGRRKRKKDREQRRNDSAGTSQSRSRRAGRLVGRVLVGTALMSSGLIAAFVAIWFAVLKGPADSILLGANFNTAVSGNAVAELPQTLPLVQPTTTGTTANPEALRREAERGDPAAQAQLALLYVQGRALPQDHAAATRWFTAAATAGLPEAQYNLGVVYSRGLGGPRDPTQAAIWFHSAAEQGYVKAQYALGLAYARGAGVERNYPEAAAWLQRAAEQGDPDAQFALATILEDGVAGPADPDGAYYWYQAAVANGSERAAERAALLVPRLAPSPNGSARPAPRPTATTAFSPESVRQIQQLLAELDFFRATPDGQLGPATRAAIRDYQAQLGLPVDGEATAALLDHLMAVTSPR